MQQEFLIAATVMAMSLLAAAALILSFLPWKAHPVDPGLPYRKAQRVDPGIEREFNKVFMTVSKKGKEALIKRWVDRKKCDREEAMRLAVEELLRDNR